MIKSSQPRNQRRFRFNAPMHQRQHFMHAHIDKALKKKLNLKVRTVQIAKGDTVKIMAGAKRGTTGKVTSVSMRKGKITLDSLVRKNSRGKELPVPISVSLVYITDLNLSDKYRAGKLKVAVVPQKKEEKKAEAKPAATATMPAPAQPAAKQPATPQQQTPKPPSQPASSPAPPIQNK